MPAKTFPAPTGASSRQFFAVTPSDTADLAYMTRALYVGTGGDIAAVNALGANVVFKNVPDASRLDIATSRVRATGTTATNIVALA